MPLGCVVCCSTLCCFLPPLPPSTVPNVGSIPCPYLHQLCLTQAVVHDAKGDDGRRGGVEAAAGLQAGRGVGGSVGGRLEAGWLVG